MNTLISDPRFSTLDADVSKWTVRTHEEAVIVPTVDGTVLRLAISNTSGANWHGELCYAPFPVVAGSKLAVSFAARARESFAFSVWLGQSESPYRSLVAQDNHFGEQTMTSEWRTYAHQWHPTLSEQAARLNFVLGQTDNQVELKEITLTPMP